MMDAERDEQVLGVLPGQGWTDEGEPVIAWVVERIAGAVEARAITRWQTEDPDALEDADGRVNQGGELEAAEHRAMMRRHAG